MPQEGSEVKVRSLPLHGADRTKYFTIVMFVFVDLFLTFKNSKAVKALSLL